MATLQNVFDKYDIPKEAQNEITNAFEKMIVQVFYKELKSSKAASTPTKPNNTKNTNQCSAKCYVGTSKESQCSSKPVDGSEFCKRHKSGNKTSNKKINKENHCNGIIKKTNKSCNSAGTIKPDGAEFHYCKRHSEKWKEFEV